MVHAPVLLISEVGGSRRAMVEPHTLLKGSYISLLSVSSGNNPRSPCWVLLVVLVTYIPRCPTPVRMLPLPEKRREQSLTRGFPMCTVVCTYVSVRMETLAGGSLGHDANGHADGGVLQLRRGG